MPTTDTPTPATEQTAPESDENLTTAQEIDTEQPETEGEPTEAENDGEKQTTDKALRKARQEAAEHRVKAKEAEHRAEGLASELEAAQEQLASFQQSYLAEILDSTDVSLDAFTAAGHTLTDLLDKDGKLDPAEVGRITAEVGQRFGRTRTVDAADRAMKRLGGKIPTTGNSSGASWGDVLKK